MKLVDLLIKEYISSLQNPVHVHYELFAIIIQNFRQTGESPVATSVTFRDIISLFHKRFHLSEICGIKSDQ
jgi:hypothetical protein